MRRYKEIKTQFPVNIKKDIEYIFRRREFYRIPVLKVKTLNNVFLTHYGILLKNYFHVKYTLPNVWGFNKPNAGFFFKFYRNALEMFLVCKYGKSLESVKLNDDNNYLFIYSPWFGYFSWITESLPRLFSLEDDLSKYTLILPDSYSRKKFVMDSLQMFPNLKIEVIPSDKHMFVKKITVPELKPFTYVFDPEVMTSYRQKVWNYVEALNLSIKTYDRIYVSRKKAQNRKLENEEDALTLFEKYGFEEIIFENYTIFEQVYLMMNCKIIAGVHGAGFANLSFMNSGAKVLELIKEYSSYKEERPSFWRLSSTLDIEYYIQYCKPVKYGNYDLWVSVNLIVDIDELNNNLVLVTEV